VATIQSARFERGAYRVSVGARSDIGKVRAVNEDDFCMSPRIWAVSDGMGGHDSGDVAASICVEVLANAGDSESLSVSETGDLVSAANLKVRRFASEHGRSSMGATLVGVALAENGETESLVVFNVGDSRCYELADGASMQQVTLDHSLVQEMVTAGQITAEQAAVHPQRNVITRGVGIDPHVQPDLTILSDRRFRRLLLCSDGVSGELDAATIESALEDADSASAAADILIEAALSGPARDNATVLVIDVEWVGAVDATVEPIDADITIPRVELVEHAKGGNESESSADRSVDVDTSAQFVSAENELTTTLIDHVPAGIVTENIELQPALAASPLIDEVPS